MLKTFGSHNMTMFYPNPYYNAVCYKGTELYIVEVTVSTCLTVLFVSCRSFSLFQKNGSLIISIQLWQVNHGQTSRLVRNSKIFSLLFLKTSVVGSQKNPLNATVLLNPIHKLKLMDKKILKLLRPKFLLT